MTKLTNAVSTFYSKVLTTIDVWRDKEPSEPDTELEEEPQFCLYSDPSNGIAIYSHEALLKLLQSKTQQPIPTPVIGAECAQQKTKIKPMG